MTPPLTVAEVAVRAGVSETTVLCWLSSGELRGWDASRGRGPRRQWRVEVEDWERFHAGRFVRPAAKVARRKRVATTEYV